MLFVSVVAGSVPHDVTVKSQMVSFPLLAVLNAVSSPLKSRVCRTPGMTASPANNWRSCRAKGPVALMAGHCAVIMPMATRMVIDNVTVLANYFAIQELTLGSTVIAVGTSLP
ncbi:hypothetical protein KCP74_08665 [Salmonella enterica subsp. enterica]|nr:hypothetical protein KCP74_08665 [Salmonella enterica subsp. enterica]